MEKAQFRLPEITLPDGLLPRFPWLLRIENFLIGSASGLVDQYQQNNRERSTILFPLIGSSLTDERYAFFK
jgi:hypothetical protein